MITKNTEDGVEKELLHT